MALKPRTIVACVGGYLGAGKTTALQAAATELGRRGKAVAVITNDQGSGLVDTELLQRETAPTSEIAGGCFCCKFDELVTVMASIVERRRPDIILAEAVGSCTDLSATVYQPLRKYHPDAYSLAPLSIVVEPKRIRALRDQAQEGPSGYLASKQLAEADLVVLSKVDTVSAEEHFELARWLRHSAGDVPLHAVSSKKNIGVAAWVDNLLCEAGAGNRLLDIDYDTYAAAEAALGWLNATIEGESTSAFSAARFAEDLLRRIQAHARRSGAAVAHVKALVECGQLSNKVAITDNHEDPAWATACDLGSCIRMSIIINARVCADPQRLSDMVDAALTATRQSFGVSTVTRRLECFSPARPTPRHRFTELAQ